MPPMPFIDMSPTDIEEFPDCDERAVLLAALFTEESAHKSFKWCNTQPVVFQYLYTAAMDTWPRASYYPVDLNCCESLSEQISTAARRLRTDRTTRKKLGREDSRHLGVGLIQELIVVTPSARKRARQVFGILATGEPFRVRRIRGNEPTVSFAFGRVVGPDAGLRDAMIELNDGFSDAHRNGARSVT